MKTLSTTALLMITSLGAFSQDTLFTRNGEMIPAKVYEITQTDIKYKKAVQSKWAVIYNE